MYRRILVSLALVLLLLSGTPLMAAPLEHGETSSWFGVVVDLFEALLEMGPHADPIGSPKPNTNPGIGPGHGPFTDPGEIPGQKMGPHAEPGGDPQDTEASEMYPMDPNLDHGPLADSRG